MSMTLSGDGSITGLVAGGLPDATITQPELATGVAGTGPAFSAYALTGVSTTTGTLTKIGFDTEEFDTNNNFASSRFTPTVAGYYQVGAGITGGYSTQIISIFKNGAEYKRGAQTVGASLQETTTFALVYCNGSTDYIEVYWAQFSGGTVTSGVGQALTYFQGCLVRSA